MGLVRAFVAISARMTDSVPSWPARNHPHRPPWIAILHMSNMASMATDQTLGEFTYRQPVITDHTLDDNGLEDTCPLDNNKHSINPNYSLGLLDTLPLEVLCDVLVGTDLRSLTDFRCVNKRGMQVVDSIP